MTDKFKNIDIHLMEYTKICVAFSGGVDSSVLLHYLVKIKGPRNVMAITVKTPLTPPQDMEDSALFAASLGILHVVSEINVLENENVKKNGKDRCYFCKKQIFHDIIKKANGYVVVDGSNYDDRKTYRPGLLALNEMGILSPLSLAGITKAEVREYAAENSLPSAAKPSSPCYATRFPYGDDICLSEVYRAMQGESLLVKYGQTRLRVHKDIARVEVLPEYFNEIIKDKQLIDSLRKLGYKYITLDLEGFSSGSMDK